jgi:phosphoglycerate dehydrogenase-like enzyme
MAKPTVRIAVLDDYQGVALTLADWSRLHDRAEVTVFRDHLADPDAVAARLEPFEVLSVMRERTPLPRALLERLPNLRLVVSTGPRNAAIDTAAAAERGVEVMHTGYFASPTVELAWALILASARDVVGEANAVRAGGWQRTVGLGLKGKTLGVLGLGSIGHQVAAIGQAFGMRTIAWSENLTAERAAEHGVERVERDELFTRADVLTIHLVLSDRTRGLVDARLLGLMKPTAHLINTSRGPIVEADALLAALREKRLARAALDVFDVEPLLAGDPFRTAPNLIATPHLGYVADDLYRRFFEDTVTNIAGWLDRAPT